MRESIVDEKALPLRFTAGTLCFRAEAGAAGKDTRGMIRQHQFKKVELVSITTPEQSRAEHERMTALRGGSAEAPRPAFPHRRALHGRHGLRLAKDLRHRGLAAGAGALPRDFLLLDLRRLPGAAHERALKAADAKSTRFVHTLNGSGVAVGRALVAVLENYQEPDGSVAVPEAFGPTWAGSRGSSASDRASRIAARKPFPCPTAASVVREDYEQDEQRVKEFMRKFNHWTAASGARQQIMKNAIVAMAQPAPYIAKICSMMAKFSASRTLESIGRQF